MFWLVYWGDWWSVRSLQRKRRLLSVSGLTVPREHFQGLHSYRSGSLAGAADAYLEEFLGIGPLFERSDADAACVVAHEVVVVIQVAQAGIDRGDRMRENWESS